jgi:hypothetical protein
MSKEEIKYEISKVLDQFPDKALSEILIFLKKLESTRSSESIKSSLNKILSEDNELLTRLAK